MSFLKVVYSLKYPDNACRCNYLECQNVIGVLLVSRCLSSKQCLSSCKQVSYQNKTLKYLTTQSIPYMPLSNYYYCTNTGQTVRLIMIMPRYLQLAM